jgi:hypothetical protein
LSIGSLKLWQKKREIWQQRRVAVISAAGGERDRLFAQLLQRQCCARRLPCDRRSRSSAEKCICSMPIAVRSWRPCAKSSRFSDNPNQSLTFFHKTWAWGLRNGSYVMSWDSAFAEPIDLPNNVVATTLRHVIAYIDELPDAEQNLREWQNARKRSLQAADQVGSIWFARIAVIQALKRRMPRFRRRSWSPEELRLLDKLVVDGASPRTAAEALNRSQETVRTKARMIGCPFPHRDEVKRQPLPKEEESRGQMP